VRWSLLLVVMLLAAGFAGRGASSVSPTDMQLLRRYEPVLVLHPDERFQPEAVDGYLLDSGLVGGHYDQRLCASVAGPAALDCYASADAAHAESPALYGAVLRRGSRIVLEYWLFYVFDLSQITSTAGEFWQDHEGD
jgi:hypothetical protein